MALFVGSILPGFSQDIVFARNDAFFNITYPVYSLNAVRPLTDEERIVLANDANFLALCKKAAENYASYWAAHDGSGLANTEAARLQWAKNRQVGVDIVMRGQIEDPLIAARYVILGKGLQFDLAAAPVSTATIIAAWTAGNRFEEIAAQYFSILGENINMTVGGN